MKVIYFLSIFILLIYTTECLKILVVFPAPSRSHFNLGNGLARGLADKGHDVTIITPFSDKNPPKNGTYREILLTGYVEKVETRKQEMGNVFDMGDMNLILMGGFMMIWMSKFSVEALIHPNVQQLIHSGETFDVVIVEQFANDGQKALAKHFGAHLITFSSVGANGWINQLVGNPAPPSYIPELLTSFSSHMSFGERLYNSLFSLYLQLIQNLITYPEQNRQIKEHISKDIDLYDVLYNSSITLLNSHPAMNQPVPHVPSMIEIGGFHVKPAGKLPADLQKYLDEATEGVVYFSLGSHIKSADLPVEKREAILRAFAKLKQKVIWKWEEEDLPGKSDNVKIMKWTPQQEILAHKNVKVFITHGGLLSTTETTYHGVPILAIPIFADQRINAKTAENNGVGLMLSYKELTTETLESKLNEMLTNPKYSENAKKRSKIFHDREQKPMDTAVYWIEYVARHNGAQHLRVAGLDLPWYKYLLLDVILLLGFISLLTLFINIIIIRKICRKFCSCKTPKTDKNKKTN